MEIKETGIEHFKSVEEILSALNGHFKTVSAEKHPQAMARLIVEKAANRVAKNYNKKDRVSIGTQNKLRDSIIHEFRKYYGEWVNLYGFNVKKWNFRTNFDFIYKTEFGRLYGGQPGTIHDHVFYTAHCFEQHKARGNCFENFPLLTLAYKREMNTTPTSADIIKFLIVNANEFCFENQNIYVNAGRGVVVFEKLSQGVLIAKTYLLPDMDYPKKGWFKTRSCGLILDLTDMGKEFCTKFENTPIKGPDFTKKEPDYAEYVRILKIPILAT